MSIDPKEVVLATLGASAGLAGYFEVAAIQGKASASLIAGCGFTGIPSTSVGERAIRQTPLRRWASASA